MFCAHLIAVGWAVRTEVAHVDVVATRGVQHWYAEAKGRTGRNGALDVDVLYGQLLRRMPDAKVGRARFAVVVPDEMLRAACRVLPRVHALLDIEIYAATQESAVKA